MKRDINKPEQLLEIWGPFLKSPETFFGGFGVTKIPLYLEKDNV